MLRLSDAELIDVWSRGSSRHALDRALALFALARASDEPAQLADVSLPERDQALLALRCANFGERLPAFVECAGCGTRLEFELDAALLRAAPPAATIDADGLRLRPPSTRDLALALSESDAHAARRRLAARCRIADPGGDPGDPGDPGALDDTAVEAIESALARADAAGEVLLDLECDACGHRWTSAFDIAAYLWEEVDARARRLIDEVDLLARAYGWTEPDVLALGATRRAAYLQRVLDAGAHA